MIPVPKDSGHHGYTRTSTFSSFTKISSGLDHIWESALAEDPRVQLHVGMHTELKSSHATERKSTVLGFIGFEGAAYERISGKMASLPR